SRGIRPIYVGPPEHAPPTRGSVDHKRALLLQAWYYFVDGRVAHDDGTPGTDPADLLEYFQELGVDRELLSLMQGAVMECGYEFPLEIVPVMTAESLVGDSFFMVVDDDAHQKTDDNELLTEERYRAACEREARSLLYNIE